MPGWESLEASATCRLSQPLSVRETSRRSGKSVPQLTERLPPRRGSGATMKDPISGKHLPQLGRQNLRPHHVIRKSGVSVGTC